MFRVQRRGADCRILHIGERNRRDCEYGETYDKGACKGGENGTRKDGRGEDRAERPSERGVKRRKKLDMETLVREFPKELDRQDAEISYCKMEKCRIKTAEGGQVVPEAYRKRRVKYLEDLESRKEIRRSRSAWRNPMRAIEKANGSVGIVSNLMALNDLVEKDPYELGRIRDVTRAVQGCSWFTVIDLQEGFYHIEIEEGDKHKTAFEFDGRIYEWNSMVMGYKNAPQIMHRVMNGILGEMKGNGVEVYMDDIVIHGRTEWEHDELVREVMRRLELHGMRANVQKMQLKQKEVKLLVREHKRERADTV